MSPSSTSNTKEFSVFNIVDQLSLYRAYHFNKTNVIIHLICIPLIAITSFMMAAPVGLSQFVPFVPAEYSKYVNLSTLASLAYFGYFVTLDNLGYFSLPIFVLINYYGPQLHEQLGTRTAMIYLLPVFSGSWIAQFIGHGVFEKRAPAILDNLLQPLVLAPYFVGFEIAFYFGFKKELQKQMNNKAGVLLRDFRMSQKSS